MAQAIFYTDQTSGLCAGSYKCNHTHQMEKTGGDLSIKFTRGNRFELFRPGSCLEPKALFKGSNDATFANLFSQNPLKEETG